MLSLFAQTQKLLSESGPLLSEEVAQALRNLFEERLKSTLLKVLLYGPYNAGKTVLINALAGQKLFESGPIPTTSKLQPVRFAEYEIVDSPGFDAPDPAAEELSRNAARWDADLVLFVVSSSGQHESERVWSEINELLALGRSILLAVNETEPLSQEMRDAIAEQIRARCITLLESYPYASLMGPLFVNAESAFRARTAGRPQPNLERASRIQVMEQAIHEWLVKKGRYAPLATFLVSLLNALRDRRKVLEQEALPQDTEHRQALAGLANVLKEIEDFVAAEVKKRSADIAATVKNLVWTETLDDETAISSKVYAALECQREAFFQQADALLASRLAWVTESVSLGELRKLLDTNPQPLLAVMEEKSGDVAEWKGPCLPAEIEEEREVPQRGDWQFGPVVVVSLGEKTLRKSGALRQVSRMGKFGKWAAKGTKVLPLVAAAVDLGILIYDIYTSRKRLEEARKREEKRIKEQEERERRLREAWAHQYTVEAKDWIETFGQQILATASQVLSSHRRKIYESLQAVAGIREAQAQRLSKIDSLISEAEGLLAQVHSEEGLLCK